MPTSIHSKVYKDLIEFLIEARTSAELTQQAVADRIVPGGAILGQCSGGIGLLRAE